MQFNALAGTHNLSADETMLKYVFALYQYALELTLENFKLTR